MESIKACLLFLGVAVFAFRFDCPDSPKAVPATPTSVVVAEAPEEAPEAEVEEAPDPEPAPSAEKPAEVTRVVRATAYNADPSQTDSTPHICAWGDHVRPGIIAISRDLEKLGLKRGTEVFVEGIGKRIVMDRMHRRKRNQIDLFMESYDDAVQFGVQEVTIRWTPADLDESQG